MPRIVSLAFPGAMLALMAALVIADNIDSHRMPSSAAGRGVHRDLVCGMDVGTAIAELHDGTRYFFCTERCRNLFVHGPETYLAASCPVCKAAGAFTPVRDERYQAKWQSETYYFCSEEHLRGFQADPAGYFLHTMWGIPGWLYYSSVALVLVLSFGVFEKVGRDERRGFIGSIVKKNPAASFSWRSRRPRVDLLRWPWVSKLVKFPGTRLVVRSVSVIIFLFIIAAGLFGDQLPARNIAPLITWTLWWGGLILVILYAGTAWCYACPWQAIAEWAEGLRLWGVKRDGLSLGLKWPRALRNVWPAIVLFVALTWIELGFGATLNPRITAYLALGITGLAFVSAFVFERASFCRYACFVGRIIGLYSMFSPVEVRARDMGACRTCTTQSCFKGNGAGEACPTFQYLPAMEENTHCITCMECVKSCEKDNVAVSLRPWGEDLAPLFRPRGDEAALALVLLALTGFHGFTMTGRWRDAIALLQSRAGFSETVSFTTGMFGLILIPILIYAALVAVSWVAGGRRVIRYGDYFTRYAYALLPIALFYHLAHNSEHLLLESQRIVPLLSDPFGWGWDLFGTAGRTLQPLVRLSALWFIQVGLVLVGHVYSLYYARRVAATTFGDGRAVLRSQIPMLLAMVLFSLTSLWLLKQPMEMRVSAM